MPRKKRAKGSLSVSLEELSQKIDVTHYLGEEATANQKRIFAELAKDVMTNRTLDGKTINGGSFKKYTKEYAEFKGVTRDSVDLFLEGDMLDSLSRNTDSEDKDTVAIAIGSGETKKAYNHNTGDTLPKREFFGVTDDEAKAIARKVKSARVRTTTSLGSLRDQVNLLNIRQTE